MRSDARWWDGPWPWLAYLVTYGIPWLWVPPSPQQFLLSAVALITFLTVYFRSFHLTGKALAGLVAIMVAIGVALVPVGGGWSVLAVYPAMQAARLRPRRTAVWAIVLTIAVFLVAGILSRQPLTWWLPSLIPQALIGGAALSREAFYDRIARRRMRPIIVGHSLGGLLGLMLAAKYPQDIDRLVIVDASPFWGLMFGPNVTADSVRPMAQSMRDGTFSASPARREASERSIAQGLALDPQARIRIVADGLASDPQVGGRAMYEDLTTDLRPALASIKTPTLVIYAYDPTLVFPDGTKPTAEAADAAYQSSYRTMPNVKLVRIDKTRHFIMSDQPERLDEQLKPFLAAPSGTPRH